MVWLKIFWWKVFVHWKLKLFNFLLDSVLTICERTVFTRIFFYCICWIIFASKGNKSVIWICSLYLIWQIKSIILKTLFKLCKVHVLWAIVIINTKSSAKWKLNLTQLHHPTPTRSCNCLGCHGIPSGLGCSKVG